MIRARLAATPVFFIASVTAACAAVLSVANPALAAVIEVSAGLDAYRAHLGNLQVIVTDCQRQPTSGACDASRVGKDDKVTLTTGGRTVEREIRYDWLRALISRAGSKSQVSTTPFGLPPIGSALPPSVDVLLKQALERLAADAKQEDVTATSEPTYEAERRSITAILARKEYKSLAKTTLREQIQGWLLNWLDRILDRLVGIGKHVPWLASALRALFIGLVCLTLLWILIRLERQARIRLIADLEPPSNAPSSRQWQLWLDDAHKMAAQGAWREAIHFLYWSVISRLESKHVWATDRARTPREYLRLVSKSDPRRQYLTVLTRNFERTWYGGRPADPNDYESAARIAEELGVK